MRQQLAEDLLHALKEKEFRPPREAPPQDGGGQAEGAPAAKPRGASDAFFARLAGEGQARLRAPAPVTGTRGHRPRAALEGFWPALAAARGRSTRLAPAAVAPARTR